MLESEVLKRTMLRLSKIGVTIFRQNVGQAWAGSKVNVKGRSVVIENAMPITMGLTNGSGDLIGWTPVVVAPQMVGSTVAVFTSIEVKREKGGRVTPDQERWNCRVNEAGGISGIANSEDVAADIIERHLRSML
tara:strand:- start:2245 stop:2646 length:402 start_codon:yes stop_codon:yes gene_type:complete